MKFLALFIMFTSVNSFASYFAEHCSNPSSSVKWESGHNSNSMVIRYYSNGPKDKTVSLHKLKIKSEKLQTILEESSCSQNFFQSRKVYVARAEITPAEGFEHVLDFNGEKPMIMAEVICEHLVNGRALCP